MAKAYSSYQVYLMTPGSSAWEPLVDIRDFPDLQGDPNMLDTTTLSDEEETQTPGIERSGDKKFTALYTPDDYDTLEALEGTPTKFAVWFGAEGANGIFEGKGLLIVKVLGKGVDEVLEMEITLAMEEPFEYKVSASAIT